jgi:glycerol uptake facilitator-like aquaporin
MISRPHRLVAEGLGTAFLLAVVIGSGIMGERLAGGNIAIALLANSLATGGGMVVLILIFGPISGAHFNPAVTVARAASNTFAGIRPVDVAAFVGAQLLGAAAATLLWRWLLPAPKPSD